MTTKTTGVEFKRFYNDKSIWPDSLWHDDEEIIVDGESYEGELDSIPDASQVSISAGAVMFSGPDDKCPWGSKDGPSFESYFKRWKKSQSIGTMVIEFDLKIRDSMISAIKSAGGKIV